jgi:CMP-N-acetylneuraminic acid synthetase
MKENRCQCKILCLIPARGGSKGVPGKNTADLGGKPLLAWTAEAAQAAESIDRIVVSTDSREIAECAEKCGISVPWLRPAEFATDDSPVILTVLHALSKLEEEDHYIPDFVMLLQTTAPFRTVEEIDNAVAVLNSEQADTVISVCESREHPYTAKKINKNGELENFLDLPLNITQANRQTYPASYTMNGAIYISKRDMLLERKSFYGDKVVPYIMPQERSLDIDTPFDLEIARILAERKATLTF